MKTCSRCHLSKDLSEFYLRKTGRKAGQYYNHCKTCLRERGKSYYRKNRERQLFLSNQRRKKYVILKKKLVYSLKNRPCKDCGQRFPHYVMDFDHRDETTKIGNIAHLVSQNYYSKTKLLAEINKCDIVCANCHRIRTYEHKIRTINKVY